MFERLKGLLEEAKNFSLTRFVIMTFCGFMLWLMVIFTLEFTGRIDIDTDCGGTCIWLIKELISPLKPANATDADTEVEVQGPRFPIRIKVTFLP